MEYQVRLGIVGGSVPVDEDQSVSTVVVDKARRRIDRQAGARHDQQICLPDGLDAFLNGLLVQALFVKDHIGLYDAAAVAPGNALAVFDKFRAVEFVAAGAVVAQNAAVELIDPFASRLLVEAVDILGDHSGELPFPLPLGKGLMGYIGLEAQRQHLLPVEAEEVFRPTLIEAVADDCLGRVFELLAVKAVHTSEIGDPRFRRVAVVRPPFFAIQTVSAAEIFNTRFRAYASTRKGHNAITLRNPPF